MINFSLDWQKTEDQKHRETLLLAELITIVNKRDELVHHLDSQEQAYVLFVYNYLFILYLFHSLYSFSLLFKS